MDPNLETILQVNYEDVLNNDLTRCIEHARDYLTYVNGHNRNKANRELSRFVRKLRELGERS